KVFLRPAPAASAIDALSLHDALPISLRVALADDQALVRAGLRALLENLGIVIAFEVDDGAALLAQLAQTPVDVVLSDIRMPGMDGIAMLRRLRERGDATPVLLLTT